MAIYLLLRFGLLPVDHFLWSAWSILVLGAAALGGGVALAYEHAVRSPRVLAAGAIVLVPLTLLILWSFERDRRAVPEMLAKAETVHGVVQGHNVLGNLGIMYQYNESRGRLIAPQKYAHAQFAEGDSIQLYFERAAPHRFLDVWPPGPDLRKALWQIFWLWIVGGALLVGYVPRITRWFRKQGGGQQQRIGAR